MAWSTSYVDSNLLPGEKVVYRAQTHWMIYAPGVLLLPIVIGAFVLLWAWVRSVTDELAVTNQRAIHKTGVIGRSTLELRLAKVETIGVEQSVFGRLLGYGTVIVSGTGGTTSRATWVSDPLAFRKAVQEQSH